MVKTSVLFVCTGNICRSPTAEAVFRHIVEQKGAGARFHIDSAGTHGYHIGDAPDSRAIAVAARRGVDMAGLQARKVQKEDFERFDHVFAMDAGHFQHLQDMCGGAKKSRAVLAMFDDEDVPDPYYGSMADFERVYDIVERGCEKLLSQICASSAKDL